MLPRGIDLSSNDYLGYSANAVGRISNPSYANAVGRISNPSSDNAVGRISNPSYAVDLPHSGMASRLLRGHHAIWEQVETELARWHGAESALMLTSGYAANEGLLSTIIEPDDWVASDERNHASIIDGLRLSRPRRFVYRHNDLDQLEEGLRAEAARRTVSRELFVVTEALYSMDGDRTPLAELAELTQRYEAHLIVDEAHATGCFGPAGSGRVDELGLRGKVLATIHTGGKALGVPGAYIGGSGQLKEYLVNRCRQLIFTTAPAPAIGAWWQEALRRTQADDAGRRSLCDNTALFRSVLTQCGVAALGSDYIVPILLGDDARVVGVANRLQEQGFDIRAIRPPTVPSGTARLRVCIHANHEPKTLQDAAAAIAAAIRAG